MGDFTAFVIGSSVIAFLIYYYPLIVVLGVAGAIGYVGLRLLYSHVVRHT